MNNDLFEKVKELNLPSGQYALFGSAPMAVRGLRENHDIDIIATDELFEACRHDGKWQVKRFDDGREYLAYENMEMFKNWYPGEWNVQELIDSAEIIDGLPFVSLADVVKWKKIYGREKDLKDIESIENFLRTQNKFYAGGFLWNPKTREVLLHQRDGNTKFNPNKWAFFGGLNEPGETPKQTLRRELKEELGIEVLEQETQPLCDYLNKEYGTYRYVFFIESDLLKSQMHLNEGAGFDWISLEKVFEYDLSEKPRKDLKTFFNLMNKKITFQHS